MWLRHKTEQMIYNIIPQIEGLRLQFTCQLSHLGRYYWITSRWPPHDAQLDDLTYCSIWLQDGKGHVAAEMRPGDLVFKYELMTTGAASGGAFWQTPNARI